MYKGLEGFRDFDGAEHARTGLYGLEMLFPELLLASPYVVDDPSQADFLYVWIWSYYSENALPNVATFAEMVVTALRKQGPWWDQRPQDHVWVIVYDHGTCQSGWRFREILGPAVVLQHWGKVDGVYPNVPCRLYEEWPEHCDVAFMSAQERASGHMSLPCYNASKDVVVPSPVSEDPLASRYTSPDTFKDAKQTTLLLFAGGINTTHRTDPLHPENDAGYSFGARQTVARMYGHVPGFRIHYTVPEKYYEEMASSIFCLAPAGWGWGPRFKSAATRGCIPVIVQDGIKVDFEDHLPMIKLAVRLPLMYVHRLPELLHKHVRSGAVEAMQRSLACAWRVFWWQRPHGRAFEMTLCVLRARKAGGRVELDLQRCTISCGQGHAPVPVDQLHWT